MNKDILPSGALDKSIPFGPVKPLHCTFLSHKVLLSTFLFDVFRQRVSDCSPLTEAEALPVKLRADDNESGAKKKDSQVLRRQKKERRKAKEPINVTRISTAI
jgi:hypothetical protein